MKSVFMSDQYPCFCRALRQIGYNIILLENIEAFPLPERKHADMQLLHIQDAVFTIKDCIRRPGNKYPSNVLLNCLYLGGKLYGKTSANDPAVLNHCVQHQIPVVPVNQGYSRCSALIIGENAVVTADSSIAKALENNGAEVLRISPGYILLEGYDYGFIGGSGFSDGNTVFFFGDIRRHPDYEAIRRFCDTYHKSIHILCKERPLTDIGGAVVI